MASFPFTLSRCIRFGLRAPGLALALLFLVFDNRAWGDVSLALQAMDGEPVNLSQYVGNGKWVLAMLWATDCGICKREMPSMSAFHEKHRREAALVLGIALDGYTRREAVERYLAEHKPGFPTLVGDIATVSAAYRSLTGEHLRGTPTYLLFSPAGELLGNNPGPLRPVAVEAFMARYAD